MIFMALLEKRKGRGELRRLHDEMDDLFRNFLEPWEMPGMATSRRWPALDIAETENEFIVKAEVPGLKAEDINISVHGNMLTISGEKTQEKEEKEKGYYHMERTYGTFRRDLNLASDVDPAKIEATCKDGVLSLRLPKSEKAKAIKVKVKEE
jgi:HSP20 family protein